MSSDFIPQRSFEIAFAAFRVAALFKRPYLRDAVEIAATDFYAKNKKDALGRLERLIRVAEAIGEIGQANAAVLYREIGNLQTVSSQEDFRIETIRQSEAEIESIFSKPPMVMENGNGINAAMRQTNIADFIRQCGNAAMKDIIVAFPDVSERTLRYDLQKLCDQDLIERAGNGGPSSYYRLIGERVRSNNL